VPICDNYNVRSATELTSSHSAVLVSNLDARDFRCAVAGGGGGVRHLIDSFYTSAQKAAVETRVRI
jgi:hypothetical protein